MNKSNNDPFHGYLDFFTGTPTAKQKKVLKVLAPFMLLAAVLSLIVFITTGQQGRLFTTVLFGILAAVFFKQLRKQEPSDTVE